MVSIWGGEREGERGMRGKEATEGKGKKKR